MNPITDGKPISGFPAYRVTPDGQVWTCWKRANTLGKGHGYIVGDTYRLLRPNRLSRTEHMKVGIYKGGDDYYQYPKLIHVLVLEAFMGPCPEGMQCRHLDGNPANNHVSNLVWGTPQENQLDRKLHGTSMEGSKHPMAKLTDDQVRQLRIDYSNGLTQVEIGKRYGLRQGYVSKIVNRKNWSHIKEQESPYHEFTK